MTSTVNEVTRRFLESGSYEAISRHVDAAMIFLLVLLLAERELIRAYLGVESAGPRIRPLWVAVAPLVPVFLFVVVVRSVRAR